MGQQRGTIRGDYLTTSSYSSVQTGRAERRRLSVNIIQTQSRIRQSRHHVGARNQLLHMCISFSPSSTWISFISGVCPGCDARQGVCVCLGGLGGSVHLPDHLSGTPSGCAAGPQGRTGRTSASSRYLACWRPRRTSHGPTRPRSAQRGWRGWGVVVVVVGRGAQTLISISPGYCVQTLTNHIPPTGSTHTHTQIIKI